MKMKSLLSALIAASVVLATAPSHADEGSAIRPAVSYPDEIAKSHIQADRLVVWTDLALKAQREPGLQGRIRKYYGMQPLELTIEKVDQDQWLRALNKASELVYAKQSQPQATAPKGEFEKTADYERRVASDLRNAAQSPQQSLESMRAGILNDLVSVYLGPPIALFESYDADTEVVKLHIVERRTRAYGQRPWQKTQVDIPLALKLNPQQAKELKDNIERIVPVVAAELNNNVLTAKLVRFDMWNVPDDKIAAMTGAAFKGVTVDYRFNQDFSAAAATKYASDVQRDKNARDQQYQADLQKMSWYGLYSRFRDAPIACDVMRHEIVRTGIMNGSSPEGQAKTLGYAKSVAASAPKCLK